MSMSKPKKTVNRAYGGSRCHQCLRQRYAPIPFSALNGLYEGLCPCTQDCASLPHRRTDSSEDTEGAAEKITPYIKFVD